MEDLEEADLEEARAAADLAARAVDLAEARVAEASVADTEEALGVLADRISEAAGLVVPITTVEAAVLAVCSAC